MGDQKLKDFLGCRTWCTPEPTAAMAAWARSNKPICYHWVSRGSLLHISSWTAIGSSWLLWVGRHRFFMSVVAGRSAMLQCMAPYSGAEEQPELNQNVKESDRGREVGRGEARKRWVVYMHQIPSKLIKVYYKIGASCSCNGSKFDDSQHHCQTAPNHH